MFKKVELWIVLLLLMFSLIIAIFYGFLVRQGIESQTKFGSFSFTAIAQSAVSFARLPEQIIRLLLKPNPLKINDNWDEQRSFYSFNGFVGLPLDKKSFLLLSRFDAIKNKFSVELIDLKNFSVIHSWYPNIEDINQLVTSKEAEYKNYMAERNKNRFRIMHPILSEDGSLIFHGAHTPLIKINFCSEFVWMNQSHKFHHSIEQDSFGDFWTAGTSFPYSLDRRLTGDDPYNFQEDSIYKFSNDGKLLYKKSIPEIFFENNLDYLITSVGDKFLSDPIHINDIQPALSDGLFWKKGDLFLSLRHQSMIMLFRPKENKLVWWKTGNFHQQHDVDILNDHSISIFNNNSRNFYNGNAVKGVNELLIYNFKSNVFKKYLNDSFELNDIRTITEGRSEILDDGSMLIEESNFGRTLFFNADGELQWFHVNGSDIGDVFHLGWSRILHTEHDLSMIENILKSNACPI